MNVEFLESISNLLNKNEETYWQKASASLDASAKIYGFRVDSVHTETFRFLGGLSRNEKSKEEEGGENEINEKKEKDKRRNNGICTIEKDVRKLNLTQYDLEFEIDPLFKSMASKFNESGAKGLLLNNFPLNDNLDVMLESKPIHSSDNVAVCSSNPNEFSDSIQDMLNNFVSDISIEKLTTLQIAPDLGYFKQTRNLETSIEKSFYNNLMNELDNDGIDELDEEIDIGGGDDNMDNILPDTMSAMSQSKSEFDSANPQELSQIEINDMGPNISMEKNGTSLVEGFSLFKHDDILEYENKFGTGNKMINNLPQFQLFMKAFNKLDNTMYLRGGLGKKLPELNREKKIKKEEKLFVFSEEEEVARSEIFGKESKMKKVDPILKKEEKKKVKQFYNYDRLGIFRQFNNKEKSVFLHSQENDIEPDKIIEDDDILPNGGQPDEDAVDINQSMNLQTSVQQPNNTFVKFDQEYEKKFGQLYKRFDVKFIKQNIWNTFETIEEKKEDKEKEKKVDFKAVVTDMSKKMEKNVLDNISTSTCFVCLLHLCNEKSKYNI